MKLNTTYKIGQKLVMGDHVMTVIGYEYIEGRSLRYVLLSINDNKSDWSYYHEFEIKALLEK